MKFVNGDVDKFGQVLGAQPANLVQFKHSQRLYSA
jgi:hypothetical protein